MGLRSRVCADSLIHGLPPLARMRGVSPSACPWSPYRQCYAKLAVNRLSSITPGALQALQTSRPKPRRTGKAATDNGDRIQMMCIFEWMNESSNKRRTMLRFPPRVKVSHRRISLFSDAANGTSLM